MPKGRLMKGHMVLIKNPTTPDLMLTHGEGIHCGEAHVLANVSTTRVKIKEDACHADARKLRFERYYVRDSIVDIRDLIKQLETLLLDYRDVMKQIETLLVDHRDLVKEFETLLVDHRDLMKHFEILLVDHQHLMKQFKKIVRFSDATTCQRLNPTMLIFKELSNV
ncbi:hypothetical protein Lal_00030239 [Lupinus albus]|nr:hypothetical protein Lal_00030239 [Lupinus albus]